jgi:WD40 repeat protein
MLYKTNILALVGGGIYPKFSLDKITIWDDHQGKIISQIKFNSEIMQIKIHKDAIIGILKDKIYILNLITLETIDILETYDNPKGIFSSSFIKNNLLVAFPCSKSRGYVQIENYFITKVLNEKKEGQIITAHESQIAYITVNNKGTILATASDKGTYIRIFLISKDEHPIVSLKRGAKTAKINCLAFDSYNEILGCSSDSGTIHIFNISEINKLLVDKNNEEKKEDIKEGKQYKNDKSKNYKVIPKINIKEKSFARFKILESQSILGFYQPNRIIILTSSGKYFKVNYDTKGGCNKLKEGTIEVENINL